MTVQDHIHPWGEYTVLYSPGTIYKPLGIYTVLQIGLIPQLYLGPTCYFFLLLTGALTLVITKKRRSYLFAYFWLLQTKNTMAFNQGKQIRDLEVTLNNPFI